MLALAVVSFLDFFLSRKILDKAMNLIFSVGDNLQKDSIAFEVVGWFTKGYLTDGFTRKRASN